MTRLFEPRAASYSWRLAERDESGARALSELKDRGLNLIANALAQSSRPHPELLQDAQARSRLLHRLPQSVPAACDSRVAVCMPEPAEAEERKQSAAGLYDVCLALTSETERSSETG